jgi:L-ornithine Nalpha-acyltransferase
MTGRHDLAGPPTTIERLGSLETRLAVTKRDVRRAQRLRYRVFFEEGAATPDPTARLIRRDVCRFDAICDHLLVVDHACPDARGRPKVVGVYRLLRQDIAERHCGFYSAGEFEIDSLLAQQPDARLLEVGRACIAPSHRGRRVLDMLWRGLWAYAQRHGMDALIGCASLPGADPTRHAATIRALAQEGIQTWRVAPRPDRAATRETRDIAPADPRALARLLPPLVKGYWRLGATFSPRPAVDRSFDTTDLFVALPLASVEERYLRHFGVHPAPRPVAA